MPEVSLRAAGQWEHLGSPGWSVTAPTGEAFTLEVGYNIAPRAADFNYPSSGWTGVWVDWDWTGKIKRDIDLAAGLGGTIFRIIGGLHAVIDGHITQAVYLQRMQQVLDYCESIGVRYYATGGDVRPWTAATLPAQAIEDFLVAQATILQAKPAAVFGFDLNNEISALYPETGGDHDPVTIRGIMGGWAQAVKAVAPDVAVTVSMAGFEFRNGYREYPELNPYLDFFDFHAYTPITAAMLAPWSEHKPVVLGEIGALRDDPNREFLLRGFRDVAVAARVQAVLQWDIVSPNYGMYDENGANLDPAMASAMASFPTGDPDPDPEPDPDPDFAMTSIPDLSMWWDASTLTSPDGTLLAAIPDLSGNDHGGTQPSPARQPIVRTNGLNGKRVLEFDGSKLIDSNYVPATGADARTIVTVLTDTAPTSAALAHVYHYGTASPSQAYGLTSRTGGVNKWGAHYWSGQMTNGPATTGAPIILIQTYEAGTDRLYNGTTQIGTATIDLTTGSATPLRVGSSVLITEPGNFRLAEIAAWPRALTPTERATVAAALAAKWGITA